MLTPKPSFLTRNRLLLLIGGAAIMAMPLFTASCLGDGGEASSENVNGRDGERTSSPDEEALNSVQQLPHKAVCDAAPPGYARCHARIRTKPDGSIQPLAAPSGLTPADLQAAYAVPANGTGTIAIVDAQDDPNAEKDLAVYRAQFGLPPCTTANGCFKKVNQSGAASPLPKADTGWAGEIALDLDMASAVCPSCKILLVEANSASMTDLGTAVNAAASLGATVISNSYGGAEDSSVNTTDAQYFNHPGIAITVSSGDNGYGVEYPASSAHVIAVGGTSLVKNAGNARGWTEGVWSGAGSGCSKYVAKPAAQTDVSCAKRTVADVAAIADPNTGVAVYDTYGGSGWAVYGGTSAASPIVAAVLAATGRGNVDNSWPYSHTGAFYDVTTGNNGSCSGKYLCTGAPGYDGPTGLGTPNGALIASGGGGGAGGGSSSSSAASSSSSSSASSSSSSGGGGSCAHPICSTGTMLTSGCDPCATKVCAADSYCCSTSWDSVCVGEVQSVCGETCGGGGGSCAHSICAAGPKLTSSCDPCATKICAADSYCCGTLWDSTCVSEVKSICGETCN